MPIQLPGDVPRRPEGAHGFDFGFAGAAAAPFAIGDGILKVVTDLIQDPSTFAGAQSQTCGQFIHYLVDHAGPPCSTELTAEEKRSHSLRCETSAVRPRRESS